MVNPASIPNAMGGGLTRRQALKTTGAGFGYLALAGLLGKSAPRAAAGAANPQAGPLPPRGPHFPAPANRGNFLFMEGANSPMEHSGVKPQLYPHDGPL